MSARKPLIEERDRLQQRLDQVERESSEEIERLRVEVNSLKEAGKYQRAWQQLRRFINLNRGVQGVIKELTLESNSRLDKIEHQVGIGS